MFFLMAALGHHTPPLPPDEIWHWLISINTLKNRTRISKFFDLAGEMYGGPQVQYKIIYCWTNLYLFQYKHLFSELKNNIFSTIIYFLYKYIFPIQKYISNTNIFSVQKYISSTNIFSVQKYIYSTNIFPLQKYIYSTNIFTILKYISSTNIFPIHKDISGTNIFSVQKYIPNTN